MEGEGRGGEGRGGEGRGEEGWEEEGREERGRGEEGRGGEGRGEEGWIQQRHAETRGGTLQLMLAASSSQSTPLTFSPLTDCVLAVAVGNSGGLQPDFQWQLGEVVEDERRPNIDHLLSIIQGDGKHQAGHSLRLVDLQGAGHVVTMRTCMHTPIYY